MKLLYYSTALLATHGGSNQSKEFLRQARKNVHVNAVTVFPSEELSKAKIRQSKKLSVISPLRRSGWFQIASFYRKQQFYKSQIVTAIQGFRPSAIVFQVDSTFLQIPYLKSKFPNLVLATIINTSAFDEPYRNIALKNYFRGLERKALEKADLNVFVSDHLRLRIMKDQLDRSRDVVVSNGVDLEKFGANNGTEHHFPARERDSNQVTIGYCGTLDKDKKLKNLILAIQELRNRYDIKLVVIGGGPEHTSIRKLVSDLDLDERVVLTGWVDHEMVPHYLSGCDIAIHHEARSYMNPLKLFEYMALKLPVIGPDIPAVHEIFRDEVDLLLTSGKTEDIVQQLDRLIRDDGLRKSIALQGFQNVQSNYSWQQHTEKIIDAIRIKIANTPPDTEISA